MVEIHRESDKASGNRFLTPAVHDHMNPLLRESGGERVMELVETCPELSANK